MSISARPVRLALLVAAMAGVVAASFALGVGAARAASPSPSASSAPLTLRIGWTSEPDNLNPFIGWQNSTYEIWSINYDFLFGFGAANSPTLDLAREFPTKENGGISADGKVWTIKLRTGVKWSDGQPMTADDVAFTYNYVVKNKMLNMAITTVGIRTRLSSPRTSSASPARSPRPTWSTSSFPSCPSTSGRRCLPRRPRPATSTDRRSSARARSSPRSSRRASSWRWIATRTTGARSRRWTDCSSSSTRTATR